MSDIPTLQLLSQNMELEPAEETGCPRIDSAPHGLNISHAVRPDGTRMRLLKTLLTSACERNCFYCPFRAGRDYRRATFTPDQMAQNFMDLHRSGLVDGMFLSSGIAGGGVLTQDRLIDTVEILRRKLGYTGYVHLKLMPGAEKEQVFNSMQLADRVSVNLEGATHERLERLAPGKDFFTELLKPLQFVEEIRKEIPGRLGWNGRWPSTTTQFVVGAVGETDVELLGTTAGLYQQFKLKRAYYSTFRPVSDTPFENLPPGSPVREHRLYQASFLLRDYGFDLEELPFTGDGNLPLHHDPKTAWAEEHYRDLPVEINSADRRELLRIPGFGLKSVTTILSARRQNKIRTTDDLRRLGVHSTKALPFILLSGKRPARQLLLPLG